MAATEEASEDIEAVMQRLSEVTSTPGQELCGCFLFGTGLLLFNVINPRFLLSPH